VFAGLRRIGRRILPRKKHPLLDAELRFNTSDAIFEAAYLRIARDRVGEPEEFITSRYKEACRWRGVWAALLGRPEREDSPRLLDVGAGNGATELAFRAAGYEAFSVDSLWNDDVRRLFRALRLPICRVVADAHALPFDDRIFDGILCLETIEHLSGPREAGDELGRVLKSSCSILLTTPPRLRYLLKPDPHFGIPALLLLPTRLQRRLAAQKGFTGPEHFVARIYWTVWGIAHRFRSFRVRSILTRSRAPRWFFWDAVVLSKR
jgi:SAM-dependent methyltransferase